MQTKEKKQSKPLSIHIRDTLLQREIRKIAKDNGQKLYRTVELLIQLGMKANR